MTLTFGKIRGLDALASPAGTFAILALDHRGTFAKLVTAVNGREADWADVVAEKVRLAAALLGPSTAALFDPLYAAGPLVARGVIPGSKGFLVAVERTGYDDGAEGRVTVLEPDWGVPAIKRMGAAGVKLLVYYHPEAKNAAAQRAVVERIGEECARHDLVFVLEPVTYPILPGQPKDDPRHQAELADLVVRTAEDLVPFGVDLLKCEYPVVPGTDDHAGMVAACRRISDAVDVPWVVLSGGVAFDLFERQVAAACEGGASGFLAGRAIWKEAMAIADVAGRDAFLRDVAAPRMRRLAVIAEKAVPWRDRPSAADAAAVAEGWQRAYDAATPGSPA
jgi:tagatose 1,6-diphosphate aldolase